MDDLIGRLVANAGVDRAAAAKADGNTLRFPTHAPAFENVRVLATGDRSREVLSIIVVGLSVLFQRLVSFADQAGRKTRSGQPARLPALSGWGAR